MIEAPPRTLAPVFQEPPDGLDSEWTHGALLAGIGQYQSMEWLEAARVYSATALHLVDRALTHGVRWDEAHPALFMCRHSLELYLKAAIPGWTAGQGRNGHDLLELISRLRSQLQGRYRSSDIEQLCTFIGEFADFDPKAMVFRFPDGGPRTFRASGKMYDEVWVDFRALRASINAVFDALDRLCLSDVGRLP